MIFIPMSADIETETKCAICLEDLDNQQTHKLPCGHTFHTTCQIIWFRNGNVTCPTCRSSNNIGSMPRNRLRRNQTAFQIMSQRARRNDAPLPLKRAYEKYKKAKDSETSLTKEITTLRNNTGKYSDIDKQIKALRRKKWSAWRIKLRLHREISNLCEVITVFG